MHEHLGNDFTEEITEARDQHGPHGRVDQIEHEKAQTCDAERAEHQRRHEAKPIHESIAEHEQRSVAREDALDALSARPPARAPLEQWPALRTADVEVELIAGKAPE